MAYAKKYRTDVADDDTAGEDAIDAKTPIEITAQVVDNAYVCLCIDGKTFELRQDEMHRLRKVMDRAAIELPR